MGEQQRVGLVRRFPRGARLGLLFALCGCQDQGAEPGLVLLTSLPANGVEALYREVVDASEPLAPVPVEVRSVPPRVLQEMVVAFNPQQGPSQWDLALVPSTWLEQLELQQAIREVPLHHWHNLQGSLSPLALLAVSRAGKALAYPLTAEVPIFFYNPRFFPHLPTSLAAVARQDLPPGTLPLALDLNDLGLTISLLASALKTEGLVDPGDVARAWEHFAAVVGTAFVEAEAWSLWVAPGNLSPQVQLFAEGKLAAFAGELWALAMLQKLQVPFATASLPPVCEDCPSPRPWAKVSSLVVSASCPYPDLAQALALELASSPRNVTLNRLLGTLPVLGGEATASTLAENPELLGPLQALAGARLAPEEREGRALSEAWERQLLALAGSTALMGGAPIRRARP